MKILDKTIYESNTKNSPEFSNDLIELKNLLKEKYECDVVRAFEEPPCIRFVISTEKYNWTPQQMQHFLFVELTHIDENDYFLEIFKLINCEIIYHLYECSGR